MKKKSSIRFFVVRDFQFLRWKPIKSPDTWRCLQLIDPSQTYQILKHYYQYLRHTSNPNQIPRRYQRTLPTNLSLWTATSWRGSIGCTAVTQTKSRDKSVRGLRRLDTEALPKMSDCSSQRERGFKCVLMFLSTNLQHIALARFSKVYIPATCAFREIFAPYSCISVFDELPRYGGFGHPPTPPSCWKKKNNNTCYAGS